MSDTLARYVFLPYVRRGMSALLTNDDPVLGGARGQGSAQPRANVRIKVHINNAQGAVAEAPVVFERVEMYGPGDITGIDRRMVQRVSPADRAVNVEPNYFPFIEFSEADFPWRYTPSRPDNAGRLRTWLALIVLKEGEGDAAEFQEQPYRPGQPLPSIQVTVKNRGRPFLPLPDLSFSWAWAHAQVTTREEGIDADALNSLLEEDPERVFSRIVCARRLEPDCVYHAFLVPSFEAGRLAGLGEPIPADLALLRPAWDVNRPVAVVLPYYYRWDFRTGTQGDFECLVRLLQPRRIDPRVGIRDMDCSRPGYALPAAERTDLDAGDRRRHVLGLEGAMMTAQTEPTPWPGPGQDEFQLRLRDLLNLPGDYRAQTPDGYPLVVPPVYGRWHAGMRRLTDGVFLWLRQLNLDPRYRTVASFGTDVVRKQQEQLMAEAWRQAGEIEKANEILRGAQAAEGASTQLFRRNLLQLPRDVFIQMTAPIHGKVLITVPGGRTITVKQYLKESPVSPAAFDPAFRRLTRKYGPLARRQAKRGGMPAAGGGKHIIDRLNSGDAKPAGPARQPEGISGIREVSARLRPSWLDPAWLKWMKPLYLLLAYIAAAVLLFLIILAILRVPAGQQQLLLLSSIAAVMAALWRYLLRPAMLADPLTEEELTPELITCVPAKPGFQFSPPPGSGDGAVYSPPAPSVPDYFSGSMQFTGFKPPKAPAPRPADLDLVYRTLVAALDPHGTIPARLLKRLRLHGIRLDPDDLGPVMAAPEFKQPMYEALRDLSQELLVPGLRYIPNNTIGLLKTNRRFIESYMAGLNHEMARELLWREYPTDQRGTYFRQFWDVAEFVPPQSMVEEIRRQAGQEEDFAQLPAEEQEKRVRQKLKERLKDIKPVTDWGDTELSGNAVNPGEETEQLALIIRGELLKRYPSAVIYAVKAEWKREGSRDVRRPVFDFTDATMKTPVFRGTLDPDIVFLGFELDKVEAKGSIDPGQEPGWYFVFEERVAETRFGLDDYREGDAVPQLPDWDALNWIHFASQGAFPLSGYLDGVDPNNGASIPIPSDHEPAPWNSHAGNRARITMQKPVRIAVHADDMLPKQEAG